MANDATTTAAVVAAVTGVMSAGAFKFYEFILKQRREVQKEEKAEAQKAKEIAPISLQFNLF